MIYCSYGAMNHLLSHVIMRPGHEVIVQYIQLPFSHGERFPVTINVVPSLSRSFFMLVYGSIFHMEKHRACRQSLNEILYHVPSADRQDGLFSGNTIPLQSFVHSYDNCIFFTVRVANITEQCNTLSVGFERKWKTSVPVLLPCRELLLEFDSLNSGDLLTFNITIPVKITPGRASSFLFLKQDPLCGKSAVNVSFNISQFGSLKGMSSFTSVRKTKLELWDDGGIIFQNKIVYVATSYIANIYILLSSGSQRGICFLHFRMLSINSILDYEAEHGIQVLSNEKHNLSIFTLGLVIPNLGAVHYITDTIFYSITHQKVEEICSNNTYGATTFTYTSRAELSILSKVLKMQYITTNPLLIHTGLKQIDKQVFDLLFSVENIVKNFILKK